MTFSNITSSTIKNVLMIHLCSLGFILISSSGCTSTFDDQRDIQIELACHLDKSRQEERSKELELMAKQDADDRVDYFTKTTKEIQEATRRDAERRKRVGEIFGEGCFSKAKDFSSAALIFQHGDVADHYFQAFIWAKRAVDLGAKDQKKLMAQAIDRYLTTIGHKQIFATQYYKEGTNTCFCLQQVERSFSDQNRKSIYGKTIAESLNLIKDIEKNKRCPIKECDKPLKSTPKGSIPGLW